MDGYAVRWSEFNKSDRITTKEKSFKTEKARTAFCEKLEAKDNFYRFEAWSFWNYNDGTPEDGPRLS